MTKGNVRVVKTPNDNEPSAISIKGDEAFFVNFSGPMAFFAAGAFLKAYHDKSNTDCIKVAMDSLRENEAVTDAMEGGVT